MNAFPTTGTIYSSWNRSWHGLQRGMCWEGAFGLIQRLSLMSGFYLKLEPASPPYSTHLSKNFSAVHSKRDPSLAVVRRLLRDLSLSWWLLMWQTDLRPGLIGYCSDDNWEERRTEQHPLWLKNSHFHLIEINFSRLNNFSTWFIN